VFCQSSGAESSSTDESPPVSGSSLEDAAPEDAVPEDPSSDESARWRDFHAQAEGFRIALPGKPELITKTTQTILGPVEDIGYRVRNRLGEFSAELHMLPRISSLFAPTRLVIAKARDNLLKNRSAKQLSFRMLEGEGYPHGILTYRSSATKFAIEKIHLVLAGRRLYVLEAGVLSRRGSPSMKRFFDSFEILEQAK
jgi:hypothetical protein